MTRPGKKQAPRRRTKMKVKKPKLQVSVKSVKYKPQKHVKVKSGTHKLKLQAKSRTHKPQKQANVNAGAHKPKPQARLKPKEPKPQLRAKAAKAQDGFMKTGAEKKGQGGIMAVGIKSQKQIEPIAESKNPKQEGRMAPKLNTHLRLKKVGADFVAYDPEHKTAFKLDPLAFFICTLCDGSNTSAQIAQKLESVLKENNLAPPVKSLGAEVEAVINTLSQNGVVFVD